MLWVKASRVTWTFLCVPFFIADYKKTPCSDKPHGYMTLKSESTQGVLCPKYKPLKLFQGFSPMLTTLKYKLFLYIDNISN